MIDSLLKNQYIFFIIFRVRLGFKSMVDPLVYVLCQLCAKDDKQHDSQSLYPLTFSRSSEEKRCSELDESKSIGISFLTKFMGFKSCSH